MSDAFREHRVRTSLSPHVSSANGSDDAIERLARNAYRQGRGVWLSRDDLERMHWQDRELILSKARQRYRGKFGEERKDG